MAKIIDPDLLNQGTEIVYDTVGKTIQLIKAGNLSDDGVTFQAVYSFSKEEWKADANLVKYKFPIVSITGEQFEFVDGWTYKDATTVELLRDSGFAVKNGDGSSAEEFAGVITLGTLGGTDQVYYQQEIDGVSSDIILKGVVNQCIKIYGDETHGDVDNRDFLKLFVREQAKKYGTSNNIDIGVSTFTYQAYRFPLTNSDDLKVTESDATVDTYGVTIEYFSTPQSRDIGGTNYNFNIIIDGNNKTTEEIYMAVQSQLRKNVDIDTGAGNVIGKTADDLLKFVGDTLVTSTGVYIDNFLSEDTNSIQFYDITDTMRIFPFVSALLLNFSDTLVTSGDSIYRLFTSDTFGTSGATLVNDANGDPISGDIVSSSISVSYDYDGEGVGDLDVTLVCIGLEKAQYVLATGTIFRSTSNSITATASLERNYSNN